MAAIRDQTKIRQMLNIVGIELHQLSFSGDETKKSGGVVGIYH